MRDLQKSIHLTYRTLMHVDELRMLDDTPVAASMASSWSGERRDVGSQLRWRIAIHLHATLQNSHQNGGRVFSSSWRIREPYGRAGRNRERLGR
jgi:hypothetical protein